MGYTHYSDLKQAFTSAQKNKIKKAFITLYESLPEHSESSGACHKEAPLVIADGWGENAITDPEECLVTNEEGLDSIQFNGLGDLSYETLYLPVPSSKKIFNKMEGYSACVKTNRKPYDLLVQAVYIAATDIAPETLSVSSNGGKADWQVALDFTKEALGRDFSLPYGVDELESKIPFNEIFSFVEKGQTIEAAAERLVASEYGDFSSRYKSEILAVLPSCLGEKSFQNLIASNANTDQLFKAAYLDSATIKLLDKIDSVLRAITRSLNEKGDIWQVKGDCSGATLSIFRSLSEVVEKKTTYTQEQAISIDRNELLQELESSIGAPEGYHCSDSAMTYLEEVLKEFDHQKIATTIVEKIQTAKTETATPTFKL